ncbi:MAG: hypothetical protein QOF18_482 [Frankiaceae bacterium]|jgi:hypothetical protein|nr:hypothetical protein [Frankiaceae bacterium]
MSDPREGPTLPDRATDETDPGWGDDLESTDDLRRFLDEVPPHHGD